MALVVRSTVSAVSKLAKQLSLSPTKLPLCHPPVKPAEYQIAGQILNTAGKKVIRNCVLFQIMKQLWQKVFCCCKKIGMTYSFPNLDLKKFTLTFEQFMMAWAKFE